MPFPRAQAAEVGQRLLRRYSANYLMKPPDYPEQKGLPACVNHACAGRRNGGFDWITHPTTCATFQGNSPEAWEKYWLRDNFRWKAVWCDSSPVILPTGSCLKRNTGGSEGLGFSLAVPMAFDVPLLHGRNPTDPHRNEAVRALGVSPHRPRVPQSTHQSPHWAEAVVREALFN